MIAATVTLATTGSDLYTLIETATPNQLGTLFTGRVAEVHIQWGSGVAFHLVFKSGTVNLATDSGFLFADADGRREYVLRATSHNQISLKDIYLAGAAGAETARISAYTI
jgi:hypothetical protein